MPSFLKVPTYRSEKWLRAVASLPCVLCFKEGMTQAAHRNEGKGLSIKAHDCWTAALCVSCHHEIDQGPGLSRDERRDRMDRAILLTLAQLAQEGHIKCVY